MSLRMLHIDCVCDSGAETKTTIQNNEMEEVIARFEAWINVFFSSIF